MARLARPDLESTTRPIHRAVKDPRADRPLRAGLAQGGARWIGILSPHPVVTRFLCELLNGSRRLHRSITHAHALHLDGDGKTPSAIVVDTISPDLGSRDDMVRTLLKRFPDTRLVALTHPRDEDVIGMLRLGITAVVQITENLDEDLTCAIEAVLSGSIWAPQSAVREFSIRLNSVLEGRLARGQMLRARVCHNVSIHAPARGRTACNAQSRAVNLVSIHAPARGRTVVSNGSKGSQYHPFSGNRAKAASSAGMR